MEKIFDFFDNHPCIATSIIGAIVTVICCISEPLGWLMAVLLTFVLFLSSAFLTYMLIINIIAFTAVSNGKIKTGIVLSIFGGFVGSLLAASFKQSNSIAIKIVSTACIWLYICIAAGGIIFISGVRLFGI